MRQLSGADTVWLELRLDINNEINFKVFRQNHFQFCSIFQLQTITKL